MKPKNKSDTFIVKKLIMDLASQIALDEHLDEVFFNLKPPEYSHMDCITVTFNKGRQRINNIFAMNEFLDMNADLRPLAINSYLTKMAYRLNEKEKKNMKTIKENWKVILIVAAGVVAVILLCVFGVQSSQNKAFALEEQVNTAESDIKVQEKRRVDLVYNLADCVMQYDKHEAETLTEIVEDRGSTRNIENVTTAITAVSEAYPELKSNENYKELMNELAITENLIAEYRSNYNRQAKEYNRYVKKFPTRIFLYILGYEVQQYLYLDYDAPVDAPQNLFRED